MAKKQWSTTYDAETLKKFQETCDEYGMKANVILEALMKFFTEGNCRIVVEKGGLNIAVKEKNRYMKGGGNEMEEMTESELIAVLIDKYTDLQRIKKANGEVGNSELEYQIKITRKKLSLLNVDVDELTL